jgi:uncharacterized protein (UPF0333 family)
MGQTQLLLVILGVILVGIAIYVGVSMFQANAVEDTRNAIITDLGNFAARARAYYWKPLSQSGGNKSFANVTINQIYPMGENANARYFIESAAQDNCVIMGVGRIVASNGDSIRVRVRVTETRNITEIVN